MERLTSILLLIAIGVFPGFGLFVMSLALSALMTGDARREIALSKVAGHGASISFHNAKSSSGELSFVSERSNGRDSTESCSNLVDSPNLAASPLLPTPLSFGENFSVDIVFGFAVVCLRWHYFCLLSLS